MTCRELTEFIADFLEDALPPETRAIFESHLEECPACQTFLETYRVTIVLERAAFSDERGCRDLPEELVRAILAARRK